MKLDAALGPLALLDVPRVARAADALGFDTLWTTETQHDPFLPLALAGEHSARLRLGTAVAIAFARSPTVVAHTAWDLAAASGGRFVLGLGTQVRAHIERRFGMPWSAPAPRLREFVQAVRAVWHAWQSGERLNYRGEQYALTLMTPFFSPPPLAVAPPPIYIAGVGAPLCRLAGEVADGFLVHPYHSRRYLNDVTLPAIEAGARRQGRSLADVKLVVTTFHVPPGDARAAAFAREQISFYASTPTYRGVLEVHGWGATGEQLSALAARGQWQAMPGLITDEMLATFAVIGAWPDLPGLLREKYAGLAEHVMLYQPFVPGERDDDWRALAAGVAG
jgi:probable F420-dependent oxidoreductase